MSRLAGLTAFVTEAGAGIGGNGDPLLLGSPRWPPNSPPPNFGDNVAERRDELALTVDVNSAGPALDGTADGEVP